MAGASFTLSGGKKLRKTLELLGVKAKNSAMLSVGFPKGRTEPDGTPTASVAYWNEFGTANIPPRPFFRNMVKANSSDWGRVLGERLVAAHYDAHFALDQVGTEIAGQLKESIQGFTTPGLAASTVARKGFDKPLIDTATMFKGVNHWVEKK